MKELIDFLEKRGFTAEANSLKNGDTSLHIYNKHIGDQGARGLADVLKTNTTLTQLNLEYNQIENEGARGLADALKTNSSLTLLNLKCNYIGVEGVIELADALKTNSSLTSLNLGVNRILGARVRLADAFKTNSSLTSLNLEGNFVGVEGLKEIEGYIQKNIKLTHEKRHAELAKKQQEELETQRAELAKKAELEAKRQTELLLLKQQLELSEKQIELAKLAEEKAEKEYKEQQQAKLKESDQIKNEKVELTPIQEQKTYAINEANKERTNELIQKLILDLTSKIGKNTDISEYHKPVMQKQVGEISSLINATNINKTNIEIITNKIIDVTYANEFTRGMLIDLEEEIKDILEHQRQRDKAFEAFEQTVAELKTEVKIELHHQINSITDKVTGLVSKDGIQKITTKMKQNIINTNTITKGRLVDLEDSVDQLIKQQNSVMDNNVKVNMVNKIIYDNPLLNHPELLQAAVNSKLSSNLIQEAINNNDEELILAGLISVGYDVGLIN